MPYLPDLPVAIGRTAACRIWAALDLRWLGSNTMACIFSARAWLGEIDRAAEDGGAYLRGQRCLIHRDARAWNLETDDAAPPR
jgi:hypothetical protein